MTPEAFNAKIIRNAGQINDLIKRIMPVKAGAMAKAHFQANFRKGGFVNNTFQPWKPAKRLSNPKSRNRNKTLLSSRNHLYSNITYVPGHGQVTLRNDTPYAAVHNEGLLAGRGKGFTMPKRQFMGDSAKLNDLLQNKLKSEINNILK